MNGNKVRRWREIEGDIKMTLALGYACGEVGLIASHCGLLVLWLRKKAQLFIAFETERKGRAAELYLLEKSHITHTHTNSVGLSGICVTIYTQATSKTGDYSHSDALTHS